MAKSHDYYCHICGEKIGTVKHLNECNCSPLECYQCTAQKGTNMKSDEPQMVTVREFTKNLKKYRPGDYLMVVDASRKKIVCVIDFMDIPEKATVLSEEVYTK